MATVEDQLIEILAAVKTPAPVTVDLSPVTTELTALTAKIDAITAQLQPTPVAPAA